MRGTPTPITTASGTIRRPGDDLDFRFILRSESDIGARLGEYISGWLKQIGIATKSEVIGDGKLVVGLVRQRLRPVHLGMGSRPRPGLHPVDVHVSGQCGMWSDTCYSNPEYDKLYKDQQTAPNAGSAAGDRLQMQQQLYKDIPEIVLYYDKSLEAYNSAKWEGLEDNISPTPEGFLWGQYTPYSALTVRLRGTEAATSSRRVRRPTGDRGYPREPSSWSSGSS